MLNAKTKGGWRPDGDIILTFEKEKNPVIMDFPHSLLQPQQILCIINYD